MALVYLAYLFGLSTRAHATSAGACEPLLFRLDVKGDRVLFEGHPVEPLTIPDGHAPGWNNKELFRSHLGDRAVLLKLPDDGARDEFRRARPGHLIGGPELIGLAQLRRADGSLAEFIVMEELFAGQPSVTFQGLHCGAKAERETWANRMVSGPPSSRLTRRLADWLARGWTYDVLPPLDVDFIMTEHDLRLIDLRGLTTGRRARTGDWDRFFVNVQLKVVGRQLDLTLNPDVARVFRKDMLEALRVLVDDEDRFEHMERSAAEVHDPNGGYIEMLTHLAN